jgi:hypothetical protein
VVASRLVRVGNGLMGGLRHRTGAPRIYGEGDGCRQ